VIKKDFFPYQANAETVNNNKNRTAKKATMPPIMLLPGWGINSHIWQSLIPTLQQTTDVITVDVSYDGTNIDKLCEEIIEVIDQPAILIGWSLGGMLATEVASRFPDKVLALLTLASNYFAKKIFALIVR